VPSHPAALFDKNCTLPRGSIYRSFPLGRRIGLQIRRGTVLKKLDHAMVPSQGIEPQSQDSESCVLPLNELGMVLAPGIEPRLTESKSAVLPLDEARMWSPAAESNGAQWLFRPSQRPRLLTGELLFKLDVPINVSLVVRPFRPQRVDMQPEIESRVELVRLQRLLPERESRLLGSSI
jgi:hypothetical protein